MRGKILSVTGVAREHYLIKVKAEQAALAARPGQFVYVQVGRELDPLLRRPFSIADADPEKGIIQILFRVVGRGTNLLSRYRAGSFLDFLGPLGSGFTWDNTDNKAIIVAGGIGVAPLIFLARRLAAEARQVEFFLGVRTLEELVGERALRERGIEPVIATEDGSCGHKGLVTDLLEMRLKRNNFPDRLFSCGPGPMLSRVVELSRTYRIPVQVSVEERMACGIGACLGCAVPVRDRGKDDIQYLRVCRDGPVFNGEKVIFSWANRHSM